MKDRVCADILTKIHIIIDQILCNYVIIFNYSIIKI